MASAASLRLLVEGSKRMNSQPGAEGRNVAFAAFRNIPQVHGPAQEAVAAAVKCLELELNSRFVCLFIYFM